jgi:hypothetical protein
MPNAIALMIGRLVRGVDALDVEGRVGLGVAQGLRSFSTAPKSGPWRASPTG